MKLHVYMILFMDQNLDFHVTNWNMFGTHMHWKMICKNKLLITLTNLNDWFIHIYYDVIGQIHSTLLSISNRDSIVLGLWLFWGGCCSCQHEVGCPSMCGWGGCCSCQCEVGCPSMCGWGGCCSCQCEVGCPSMCGWGGCCSCQCEVGCPVMCGWGGCCSCQCEVGCPVMCGWCDWWQTGGVDYVSQSCKHM